MTRKYSHVSNGTELPEIKIMASNAFHVLPVLLCYLLPIELISSFIEKACDSLVLMECKF